MPVSGGRFGPASVKTGWAAGASAAEEKTGSGEFELPAAASLTEVAVVTMGGWGRVGSRSAIDVAVFSIWDALKAPISAAPYPASATVPLKANPEKLRGVIIPPPAPRVFDLGPLIPLAQYFVGTRRSAW